MNKIIRLLREGFQQKVIFGQGSATIPAQEYLDFEIDVEANKFLMKSIEVTCDKTTESFRVEFFEDHFRVNSRYNSGNVQGEVYDTADMIYMDKNNQKKMYFRIYNLSTFDCSYIIEVRGLELK